MTVETGFAKTLTHPKNGGFTAELLVNYREIFVYSTKDMNTGVYVYKYTHTHTHACTYTHTPHT